MSCRTEELRRGDHIYRPMKLYSHHGIYIGSHNGKENMVIHYTRPQKDRDDDNTSPCRSCGYAPCQTGGVVASCLDCFLKGGQLRIYQYGKYTKWKRSGTCSFFFSSKDPDVIVNRALKCLVEGFGNYDLLLNNCEDFAHYCRTGLPFSAQSFFRHGYIIPYFGKVLIYPMIKGMYYLVDGMRENECMPEK